MTCGEYCMKKHLSFLCLALFLGGMISLWAFVEARAQIDFFTFFVPYKAEEMDRVFAVLDSPPIDLNSDPISVTISISVHFSDTVIYYDHWEDGLEDDLTKPNQTGSTLVWGDNDLNNNGGIITGNDTLGAGQIIVLQNVVTTTGAISTPYPFDGGDKLVAVGGPLAVTLAVWPINIAEDPPTADDGDPEIGILYAGAWELYPTNQWGKKEYQLPIGENLATDPKFTRPGFSAIFVNVQAARDNTTVELDLNADGFVEETVILDQGEQHISLPNDPMQPSGSVDVQVGGTIRSTNPEEKPIQVHFFAIDPEANYEARAFTPFPVGRWSHEYLAPRGSDGDFWLYNPNDSQITVSVETVTQTITVPITANTTIVYPPRMIPTEVLTISEPTALYFVEENEQPFYVVAALNDGEDQDWGYAVLPRSASTTQSLVGWGVGNNGSEPGEEDQYYSRLYVTALTDTTVFVDYDNDGFQVGIDQEYTIPRLQEVPITRTIGAGELADLTGAYLYTTDQKRFLAVWGQDASAPDALPSIDVGTHVVPFPPLSIQKTVNAYPKEIACSETVTTPNTIQYLIQYFNNSANVVNDVFVSDELAVPEVAYVPGSTVVDGSLIADDGAAFPLAGDGYNIGTLPARPDGNGTITFDVTVNDPTPPMTITNRAVINSDDVSLPSDFELEAVIFSPLITEINPIYQIDSTLMAPTDGVAESGETITYSVTVTNTGSQTITEFPLSYTFNDISLTYQQASVPDVVTNTAGILKWNDLTNTFGDIGPNGVISLTVTFTVNDLPATVEITNTVVGAGGLLDNNRVAPTCKDAVPIILESNNPPTETPIVTTTPVETPTDTPTPLTETPTSTPETETPTPGPDTTPTPTDSPDDDDDDGDDNDDDGGPPPNVTPTPAGNATPPPGGTPVADANLPANDLPVAFLPETGIQQTARPTWSLIILALTGIALLWGIYHRPRQ